MPKPLSFDDFLIKASITHGAKYDYSNVIWTKAANKIEVICTMHGVFAVQAYRHYKEGHGCPSCSKRPPIDTETFINRAKERNYPNHSYDKVKYKNCHDKVTITCTKHGDYLQIPFDHYSYPGCQKCRYEKSSKTLSRDRSKTSFDGYKSKVQNITRKSYNDHKSTINPSDLPRGKGLYELDHIFSIREGYEHKIPPEVIGHYTNLQMLAFSQNASKGYDCWKTMSDLYLDFNEALHEAQLDQ